MNIDDYMKEIIDEAYDKIRDEHMSVELSDFIKIESHLNELQKNEEPACEMWYLTLDPELDAPILNEEDRTEGENFVLGLKYKYSYEEVAHALDDSQAIREMKSDGAVGVIVRTKGTSMLDGIEQDFIVSILTTPKGVYLISRSPHANGDVVKSSCIPRHKFVPGEDKVIDALIESFYTW